MKFPYIISILLATLFFIQSCDYTNKECEPPPCAPSVIYYIQLDLNFDEYSNDDLQEIQIIKISPYDSSIIDTLKYTNENLTNKSLYVSNYVLGDPGSTYNLKILLSNNVQHSITNIQTELRGEECSCGYSTITSLDLNGQTIQINRPEQIDIKP